MQRSSTTLENSRKQRIPRNHANYQSTMTNWCRKSASSIIFIVQTAKLSIVNQIIDIYGRSTCLFDVNHRSTTPRNSIRTQYALFPFQSRFWQSIPNHCFSEGKPVEDTLTAFYDTTLIQDGANAAVQVRHIFGAWTGQGTFPSLIINGIETLFNPVTQSSQTQRPTFARLTTFPCETQLKNNLNRFNWQIE